MSERDETSTSFTAEPHTEVPLSGMSTWVRKATGEILASAVIVHELQYRHVEGVGYVEGLRAGIESHLRSVLPRCDPVACTMSAELIGAERTDPTSCTLALSCDLINDEAEQDVNSLEHTCLENHQIAVQGFRRYVLVTAQEVARVRTEISTAKKSIAERETYLKSIT